MNRNSCYQTRPLSPVSSNVYDLPMENTTSSQNTSIFKRITKFVNNKKSPFEVINNQSIPESHEWPKKSPRRLTNFKSTDNFTNMLNRKKSFTEDKPALKISNPTNFRHSVHGINFDSKKLPATDIVKSASIGNLNVNNLSSPFVRSNPNFIIDENQDDDLRGLDIVNVTESGEIIGGITTIPEIEDSSPSSSHYSSSPFADSSDATLSSISSYELDHNQKRRQSMQQDPQQRFESILMSYSSYQAPSITSNAEQASSPVNVYVGGSGSPSTFQSFNSNMSPVTPATKFVPANSPKSTTSNRPISCFSSILEGAELEEGEAAQACFSILEEAELELEQHQKELESTNTYPNSKTLKLKVYMEEKHAINSNQEIFAILINKDHIDTLSELSNIIIYKILNKRKSVLQENIKLSIFYKEEDVPPIILKDVLNKRNQKFQKLNLIRNDLILDYIMTKEKLYIKAEF